MFLFTTVFMLLVAVVFALQADTHESCEYWASIGECDKNPGYMLVSCQTSCQAVADTTSSGPPVDSFYDIIETDLNGNEFSFDIFKGKVVYLVNVASYCGYTEENYRMFRELKKYEPQGFVMVLAPCNSFGFQEPGDSVAVQTFAQKQQFSGVILSKSEVNGNEARPAFKYLKHVAGTPHINWNFEGKFLIGRDGRVYTTSNADIESQIQALLIQQTEL